jgi:adenosine deaminase
MRPATLVELAAEQGRRLPVELLDPHGARMDITAKRGWARFQRLYDAARDVLRGPDDLRRLVREIAEDERDAGSGWVEVQVDPSSYAARVGGLQATVELLLDAMREARPPPASAWRWWWRPTAPATPATPRRWRGWPAGSPAAASSASG